MVYANITNKHFRGSRITFLTPKTCVNIHPNHSDPHRPFSSIHCHVPVIAILFACLFFPNLVTKSLRLFLAASAVSDLRRRPGSSVLPHQMLLTWHLQQLLQCPGVSQEHPLHLCWLWKLEKRARAAVPMTCPSCQRMSSVVHFRSSSFWAQHISVPFLLPLGRSRTTGCLPHSCPQSNLVYGFGFLRGQGGWQWAVQGQFVAFLLQQQSNYC